MRIELYHYEIGKNADYNRHQPHTVRKELAKRIMADLRSYKLGHLTKKPTCSGSYSAKYGLGKLDKRNDKLFNGDSCNGFKYTEGIAHG